MHYSAKFIIYLLGLFFLVRIFSSWVLPFLFPFLLGTLLALSAEPIVRPLCRRLRLPRAVSSGIGVSCAFLILGAFLFLLCFLIFQGLSGLSRILPDLAETILSGLTLLEQWLLHLAGGAPKAIRSFLQQRILELFSGGTAFLSQGARYILTAAGGALSHIPGQAFTFITAILSGFMISSRLPMLKESCRELFSRRRMQAVLSFLRRFREIFLHWLTAELKLAAVTLLIITSGLILLKVPYAPVWALVISLLDALPLLGTGAVFIPWSLIAFLKDDPARALGLLAVYVVCALSRSLLEPRFVGKQLGLDPLITLGAMYMGYRLWGFGGMILSPLLAVTAFTLIPRASDSGKNG